MTAVVGETETRTVVRSFVEAVWNGNDSEALDRLAATDFSLHQLVAGEDHDRESFGAFLGEMHAAMPDFSMEIEDLVVEGADAVALLRMGGTPVKPLQALQPTGESFDVYAFHKYRVEDDRVSEAWLMADAVGTMRQLGLFPPGPGVMMRMVAGKLKGILLGR